MTLSVEDIVNIALRQIGYAQTIGDIYEGSAPSRAALDIYTQTRDELLRARDWSFSRRTAELILIKGPPPPGGYNPAQPWSAANYPPPNWLYEYAYPADCLKLGAVVPRPGAMFNLLPQAAIWRVDNDNSVNPPLRVILSNLQGALGVYTARVTAIATWEPEFIAILADGLGKKLAPALKLDAAVAKAVSDDQRAWAAIDDSKG